MKKKSTPKISKIKRNNQTKTKLSRQGKLKTRRNRKPQKQVQKPPVVEPQDVEGEENDSDYGEDMMHMVEKDDLDFLKAAISNKSYNILKQIRVNEPESKQKRKRTKLTEDDDLEERYENEMENNAVGNVRTKMLLPIKSRDGLIARHTIVENEDMDEYKDTLDTMDNIDQNGNAAEDEISDEDLNVEFVDEADIDITKPVSTAELLACREEVLQSRKFKIGILSSGLLENPELKSGNLKKLLGLMDEHHPEVYLTVRKLAMVSLMEVFKDLLPSYQIKQLNPEGVKLKKDTLQLQNFEATLLRGYKQYLQKLEKLVGRLQRKKGDTRKYQPQELRLGEVAVNCMCDLLVNHPYFNFSVNIARLLVPFLDSKFATVRETVSKCIMQIFKEDKRGELSYVIVRRVNQYVKSRGHSVRAEMLQVLLSLKISEVNLDKDKEEELKQKKLTMKKQRLIAMSKRERKRKKQLEEVEKELMETKAEENKQAKHRILTDITSVVFTIYFRILKQSPNSKILSVTLQGLAKFAHCINLEFYQDLMNVLNQLMDEGNLPLREQLYCVETVFAILSGQGEVLNIDPSRFYTHLYRNLLSIHAGKNHADILIILRTLVNILIKRRKKISQSRFIAFLKRIGLLSLQLEHNGTLGALGIIKTALQLGKAADILLDTDSSVGDGFWDPELDDPEYCRAERTALWELIPLQRHYHPMVQKLARNIAFGVPTSGEGSLEAEFAKLKPDELFNEYDPANGAFKPSVPVPKKVIPDKIQPPSKLTVERYEQYLDSITKKSKFHGNPFDFYKALDPTKSRSVSQ